MELYGEQGSRGNWYMPLRKKGDELFPHEEVKFNYFIQKRQLFMELSGQERSKPNLTPPSFSYFPVENLL